MASRLRRTGPSARTIWITLLVIVAILAPSVVGRAAQSDGKQASFHFKNAPLQVVLSTLEQLFDVRFITSMKLEDKITVNSRGLVSVDRMVELLDAALLEQGAVARRTGNTVRIVPISLTGAKVEMIVLKHGDPTEVAKVVNDMFQAPDLLREATAQNAPMIEKLLAQMEKHGSALLSGQMKVTATPYPRLKAVILRAPEVSFGLIKQFIQDELDKAPPPKPKPPPPKPKPPPPKPKPEKTKIYRLDYVPADYVARSAKTLKGISPIVESRINALILRTNKYEQFEQLEEVIKLLDIPESVEQETYHVTLNNATAAEVRDTLNRLYRETLRLPFTKKGLEGLTREQREKRVEEASAVLEAAGLDRQTARNFIVGDLGIPIGEVDVIEDTGNNALLIRTHPRNFPNILKLIRKLDRPKKQVLIKVFIADVKLDDTTETGVDFIFNTGDGNRSQNYAMDFDVSVGPRTGLSYTYISNNIEAFVRALQATTRLDIISRPQVLTLNNQRAEVEFGKRVPLLQTTQVTVDGAVNSTVRYENVVTRLQVTPHVNEAGFIRMDIIQTIDDVSSDTFAITEQLAPQILITRRASTQVQVRDGQTVCLGGFIGDKIDKTEQKVPFLGDIPIIGRAFSSVKATRIKSELLIFITPYILDTPEELLSAANQVRSRTVTMSMRDRPAQELFYQGAPERNPHKGWRRTSKRYTIPRPPKSDKTLKAPGKQGPPASPATQPAKPTAQGRRSAADDKGKAPAASEPARK